MSDKRATRRSLDDWMEHYYKEVHGCYRKHG